MSNEEVINNVNKMLYKIHNGSSKAVYCGITEESNIHDRARILKDLIFNDGSAALGQDRRDPIFDPFEKKEKQELSKQFISRLKQDIEHNDIDMIRILAEIGEKKKHLILDEIKTKGHGSWRENTSYTKTLKSKSENPTVRKHKDDIYQAEEYIIKAITYKVK